MHSTANKRPNSAGSPVIGAAGPLVCQNAHRKSFPFLLQPRYRLSKKSKALSPLNFFLGASSIFQPVEAEELTMAVRITVRFLLNQKYFKLIHHTGAEVVESYERAYLRGNCSAKARVGKPRCAATVQFIWAFTIRKEV